MTITVFDLDAAVRAYGVDLDDLDATAHGDPGNRDR
jgi:hypothetical protein